MPRLYLVRHGKAAANFAADLDPGLDDEGRAQAAAAAEKLSALRGTPLIASPLKRAQETAAIIGGAWRQIARVEPGVAEIPSPNVPLEQRGEWLRALLSGTWDSVDPQLRAWSDGVVATLLMQPQDCVIVTHYVVINVAVGSALGKREVVVFQPGNGSITTLDSDGRTLTVVELGGEAETVVR